MTDETQDTTVMISAPDGVTEWLLDADPAIRWQVLRDLTDAPSEGVAAERGRVESEGWGAQLLGARDPDGQWLGGACFPGRGHLGRDLLDPLERLRDDQLTLARPDRADVGGGDRRPRAAPGPGVVRPARAGRDEQHQRPERVGPGPAARHDVAERVNPLNDLVSSHSRTHLKVSGPPGQPR